MTDVVISVVSSIAGGAVGGFAGFLASIVQERSFRRSNRRNIASALSGEISALCQLFQEQYITHLECIDPHQDFASLYHRHLVRGEQEYMPIFRSLGSHIGHLPAPLPHDLVVWYTALAVALERARALHDLIMRGNQNDAIPITKLIADQLEGTMLLLEQSETLIDRLKTL